MLFAKMSIKASGAASGAEGVPLILESPELCVEFISFSISWFYFSIASCCLARSCSTIWSKEFIFTTDFNFKFIPRRQLLRL